MKHRRRPSSQWDQVLARAMASSRYYKTQAALAKKSGVAQATIGRILRGEVNAQISTMTFLAEALGIPLGTLAAAAEDEKSIELSEVDQARIDALDRNEARKRAVQELEVLRRKVTQAIERFESLVRVGSQGDAP